MAEYRFWVSITMGQEQEDAYRAERALNGAVSTRPDLGAWFTGLLEGEGAVTGWWSDVRVR